MGWWGEDVGAAADDRRGSSDPVQCGALVVGLEGSEESERGGPGGAVNGVDGRGDERAAFDAAVSTVARQGRADRPGKGMHDVFGGAMWCVVNEVDDGVEAGRGEQAPKPVLDESACGSGD
jgi:hypothetical protein